MLLGSSPCQSSIGGPSSCSSKERGWEKMDRDAKYASKLKVGCSSGATAAVGRSICVGGKVSGSSGVTQICVRANGWEGEDTGMSDGGMLDLARGTMPGMFGGRAGEPNRPLPLDVPPPCPCGGMGGESGAGNAILISSCKSGCDRDLSGTGGMLEEEEEEEGRAGFSSLESWRALLMSSCSSS